MNSVLDDNRILYLANNERIKLGSYMRLFFEVSDLAAASPTTVSRCGILYFKDEALSWRSYFKSWKERDLFEWKSERIKYLSQLFDQFVDKSLNFLSGLAREPIESTKFASVMNLCNLVSAMINP